MCSRCILDTKDDPSIRFDSQGVCNYCHSYDELAGAQLSHEKQSPRILSQIVERIKAEGKGKEYDCVMGVSGGVDSTYVALQAKKLGLRPLVVHLDNGWNSELAVQNIENIVKRLGFDLYTHVINWEEFKDMQLSYFRASVVDIEAITDHAIRAILYRTAYKHKVHYILSGSNIATEGILPRHWVHRKNDWLNIKSIHKRFGRVRLRTFPYLTFWQEEFFTYFYPIHNIPLLNFLPYVKEQAKQAITNELDWRDYGGKHYESIFTRFYQAYILPEKFGIDKRKAHLSTLICSGQISRQDALEEMKKPVYDSSKLVEDKEYVIKKLGLNLEEFEDLMRLPVRQHTDYPNYPNRHWKYKAAVFKTARPLIRLLKRMKRGLSQRQLQIIP
ncbi:MAG: N-acetyl sugar amidotransferase [Bacteroidota bacterium]